MSTAPKPQTSPEKPAEAVPKEVRIYGHSALFYWWPVWLCGFIMAFATWLEGSRVAIVPEGSLYYPGDEPQVRLPAGTQIADADKLESGRIRERMHPSKNLGIIFTVVLIVVLLITNVPLRGLSSAIAIAVILIITLLFAYLDWWETVFTLFLRLNIHMNMGFYVFFSVVLLIAWSLAFFGYDRMSYWRVTPGEITHEYVFGGGQRAFQTEGMAFEKLRDDLFRHWVLGFGSGDLIMHPLQLGGAPREDLSIHNVLFVGSKLRAIQNLIAARPEEPGG
jgi:hypothetical protein